MARKLLTSAGLVSDNPSRMGRPGLCNDEFDDTDPYGDEGQSGGGGSQDDTGEDTAEKTLFKTQADAEKAYAELRSAWGRTQEETRKTLTALEQEMQELRASQSRESRTDPLDERTDKLTDRLMDRLGKLNREDPNYGKEYLKHLTRTMLEEIQELRNPQETQRVVQETLTLEQQRQYESERANAHARQELAAYGLPESAFQTLVARRDAIQARDPQWFSRVPENEQIPELVRMFAEEIGIRQKVKAQEGETLSDTTNPSQNNAQTANPGDEDLRRKLREEQRRRTGNFMKGGAKVAPSGSSGQKKGENPLGSFTSDLRQLRQENRQKAKEKFARI